MNIVADILSGTILFAIPLLLVALGGMFSERSGIINIALEGIMVIGALFSCLFMSAMDKAGFGAAHSQLSMLAAILISGLAGMLFSMLLAFASIKLKADQTIGGTALNMLAPAIAIVITWAIQGQGQTTILIPKWARMTQESLGLVAGEDFLSRLVFKSLYLTTPIAILLLVLSAVFLYKTKLGLRLRACGEHPHAADSVGINVYKMRYLGVGISGFLGGVGGLAYSLAAGSGYQSSVAGYGFLALAVMIFGNWKPLGILGASLFFALFKIVGSYAGSLPFLPNVLGYGLSALVLAAALLALMRLIVKTPLTGKLSKSIVIGCALLWVICVSFAPFDFNAFIKSIKSSEYIYLTLPYLVTMVILILTSKKSRAPKAEGIPYDKGGREALRIFTNWLCRKKINPAHRTVS